MGNTLVLRDVSVLVFLCGLVCASPAVFGGEINTDPNDLRWDLAEVFEFNWTSAELSAQADNPAQDGQSDSDAKLPVRTIAVSVSVTWNPLEADDLVIIDTTGPQICEVVDGNGEIVECESAPSDMWRGYDDFGWGWDQDGHARIGYPLKPFPVKIRLADDPRQDAPTSISSLQGYIYAVYAEDIIKVDVPFDPNAGWLDIETQPDLTILVDPLTPPAPEPLEYVDIWPNISPGLDPSSDPRISYHRPKTAMASYIYDTWVKCKGGQRVFGLQDPRFPSSSYAFGDYAVVRTMLYDSKNNAEGFASDQESVNGTVWDGLYGAFCHGRCLQNYNRYDKIRHLILVHPVEVKIPFVLRDIPVPKP